MAQSFNSTVELTPTGISYLGMGGKVGKFLLGNKGLEFYSDANVEDYIQIPWENIEKIGANVSRNKVSRNFEVFTDKGKFLFASKDSGKILKVARQHIGNDKVVRMLTLVQVLMKKLTGFVKKK